MNALNIGNEFAVRPTNESISRARPMARGMLPKPVEKGDGDYYSAQIGRFVQLTETRERELFKQFPQIRRDIDRLLNRFPRSIINSIRNEDSDRPGRKRFDQWWWEPMNLPIILLKIENQLHQDEIQPALWEKLRLLSRQLLSIQDTIVNANLRLVASIVNREYGKSVVLSTHDMLQEGVIGMMKAIGKFDISYGNRFSTYAIFWIRQTVRRVIENQADPIRVPIHIVGERRKLQRKENELNNETNGAATWNQIATAANTTAKRVCQILESSKSYVSLDAPDQHNGTDDCNVILTDKMQINPLDQLVNHERKNTVYHVVDTLREQESSVIKLRYGLVDGREYSYAEIGRKLNLSRERVRKVADQALRRMRRGHRLNQLKELV